MEGELQGLHHASCNSYPEIRAQVGAERNPATLVEANQWEGAVSHILGVAANGFSNQDSFDQIIILLKRVQ